MTLTTRLNRHFQRFQPRERTRHLVWSRLHARGVDGRPYSHDHYPHIGAPGGPFDALDDPQVRRIIEQFGSRLGKTHGGQCAMMKKADCNPGPMMFASSVEKVASEVVERSYKMIAASPKVACQLRREDRRRLSCIDFDACQCFVAWSRSVSTLADKEVEFGHANEIDKWEHASTSKEADPLKLFLDRFKNRPHHKVILESTPTVKGKSRIESARLASTNCQFYVPCPHCEQYQTLKMDRIKWEKLENGRSDKDLARRTAHYECEHCQGKIEDHHRPAMMRAGVWCPEGCTVKDKEAKEAAAKCAALPINAKGGDGASVTDGYEWLGWKHASWIEGNPLRDGPDAGYQLSSLYALSLAWGDIAAEWVACQGKPQDLRNFVNQWLAETWEVIRRETTWESLGRRIITDVPRGVVPAWASALYCGIDRQADALPWVVDAYGPGQRCATIDYNRFTTFDELLAMLCRQWKHADGGAPLKIGFSLFDSGFRPKGVHEFVLKARAQGVNILPSKGSSSALNCDYRVSVLGKDTSMPGMTQYMIDTIRTQLWIEHQLEVKTKDDRDGYSVFAGSLLEHQDFLEQLLNDAAVQDLDSHNNTRESWDRIDENIPNDYRDCRRNAYIAMLAHTRGGHIPARVIAQPKPLSAPEPSARIRELRIRR